MHGLIHSDRSRRGFLRLAAQGTLSVGADAAKVRGLIDAFFQNQLEREAA